MKKFLMILLVFCSVFLCGCQNYPQYTIQTNDKGQVVQTIFIPFSVSELVTAGVEDANAINIGQNIKNKFDNYFLNRYENFITRLSIDEGLAEVDKMMLLAYCPTREQMTGIDATFENADMAGITYEFKFSTVMAYYYFNIGLYYEDLVKELEEDDSIIKHNFLTTQKISTSGTIYGQNTEYAEALTLAQYINKVSVETLNQEGSLTAEQIDQLVPKTFVYRYGTSYKRMHSDADNVRVIDDIYYHEWIIDLENSDREISTWYTYANQKSWYGLALVSVLIFVGVMILYCYFKDKNKDKPKIEFIEPK